MIIIHKNYKYISKISKKSILAINLKSTHEQLSIIYCYNLVPVMVLNNLQWMQMKIKFRQLMDTTISHYLQVFFVRFAFT